MKSQKQAKAMILAIKKQAGMTLMEIIAALAIIAAVVVGALALYNSAQSSNQSVTMLKGIISIRAAIQQLHTGQGGYGAAGNDLTVTLLNAGKVPSDFALTGGALPIITPVKGGLTVASAGNNAFTITVTSVPNDVCTQLVSNATSGWASVEVGGSTVAANAQAFPVQPADAATACGVPGTLSDIVWTTAQ